MRVLVLGGTRFIGLWTVRALLARGHEVAVFHRGVHKADLEGVTEILGDRGDLSAARAFAPDAVIDMFAMTEAWARAAADTFRGTRMIVLSSADVYRVRDLVWRVESGVPENRKLGEDAPLRTKRYPYRDEAKEDWERDYDKVLVEAIVRDAGATILRLPAVYGPGDYRRRVWAYLQPAVDGEKEIPIDETQAAWKWTRAYVADAADAIVLATEDARAAGRTYNVGDEDALTERAWAEAILRAAGSDARIVTGPGEGKLDFRHHWEADTTRIRAELGYRERVGRARGIEETVRAELSAKR